MEIQVVKEGSVEHSASLERTTMTIIQWNRNPGPRPPQRCRVGGNVVATWVPVRMAGVTSQTGSAAQTELELSYEEGLRSALIQAGGQANLILVWELGVGSKQQVVEGEKIRRDNGLHWSSVDSARAAKEAVIKLNAILPATTVVFVVPEGHYDEWDHVMRF